MYKTAIIIVDMVNDFVDEDGLVFYPKNKEILPYVKDAIKVTRQNDGLVIFIQHRYRKDKFDRNLLNMRNCCIEGTGGEDIYKGFDIDYQKDYIIPKRRYSSFFGTDLDLVLRENGVKNIVITGTKTNNCIYATAIDGHYLDYNVNVISDCVGTSDEVVNQVYLTDINKYLGNVITLEEYKELLAKGEL